MILKLQLPWPPSWNKLYRIAGSRMYKTSEARDYENVVHGIFLEVPGWHSKRFGNKRVSVQIDICPPDKRRRDLDNLLKIINDSLETAKIIDNDCQIDFLSIKRGPKLKDGIINLVIREIGWDQRGSDSEFEAYKINRGENE